MGISKSTRVRLSILGFVCAGIAVLATTPAGAQVTFYPSITAQSMYTTNLNFVSDQGEDLSDVVTRVSLTLPVRGAEGRWTFLYRPSIQRYHDFSELDNTSHLVQFDWSQLLRRSLTTTITSFYNKSQQSGDPNGLASGASPANPTLSPTGLTLSPRADQETAALAWGMQGQITPRWTVNGTLQASTTRTAAIPGVDNGGALVSENKNAYAVSFGASKSISVNQSIGVNYFYRTVDGQTSGGEDLHQVGMTGSYRLARRSSLEYGAGAFTRGDRWDFQGRFGYTHDLRVVNLSLLLERQSSIGGNLVGTSNNNTFSFLMGSSVEDKLVWAISTRYQLREAVGEGDVFGNIRTWAQTAGLEYRPHHNIGIRFGGTHSDQSGSSLTGLDGRFATVTLGFVWYPLGYGVGEDRS